MHTVVCMSLIVKTTCYKNPENPFSIDVILTNSLFNSFQCFSATETGLSPFHKATVTYSYEDDLST